MSRARTIMTSVLLIEKKTLIQIVHSYLQMSGAAHAVGIVGRVVW